MFGRYMLRSFWSLVLGMVAFFLTVGGWIWTSVGRVGWWGWCLDAAGVGGVGVWTVGGGEAVKDAWWPGGEGGL